jgi:hypothetical protein
MMTRMPMLLLAAALCFGAIWTGRLLGQPPALINARCVNFNCDGGSINTGYCTCDLKTDWVGWVCLLSDVTCQPTEEVQLCEGKCRSTQENCAVIFDICVP